MTTRRDEIMLDCEKGQGKERWGVSTCALAVADVTFLHRVALMVLLPSPPPFLRLDPV